jgi:hypothetical protein
MNTLPTPATPASTESGGPVIHFLTEEEEQALVTKSLADLAHIRRRQRAAALGGREALAKLVEVLRANHHTGQPYKVRALLFSLWNGKPVDLTETLNLDWELKQNFALVLLGFGYEDAEVKLFYRAIEDAFRGAGLWDWFCEEGGAQ